MYDRQWIYKLEHDTRGQHGRSGNGICGIGVYKERSLSHPFRRPPHGPPWQIPGAGHYRTKIELQAHTLRIMTFKLLA